MEDLERLISKAAALRQKKWDKINSFQKWINDRNQREFKRLISKKKKYSYSTLMKHEEMIAWNEKFKKVARRFHEIWDARIEKVSKEIFDICWEAAVPKSEEFVLWQTVTDYQWSTQTNPGAYKRNKLGYYKQIADKYGIPAKIEGDSIFAQTTPIGVEILNRKHLTLAETVVGYWRNSCQPRVDYPFLPHDFESKIGIDYFGRIVDPRKWESALKTT